MMSLFHFACLWCCWTTTLLYATTDSLFAGQYFNSSSKLCSDNRIYCLMFQVVTQYNLSGYLAIYRGNGTDWYRWVGNREQPVDIHTVRLVLSKFGKLTIESDEKVIILYEPPHPLGNCTIVAKLLNTGNFVLQSIQHTKKTTLWQSFDTPTDTMIPGMKLGKNLRAGHNWSLVSWITNWVRNPASGPYRLYWDPRDQELIISHRETIHWKSGMLRANKFEHINEVRNIEYEVVVNKDEQSFSFKTSNNEEIVWALLGNGQLMDHTTQNILADVDLCYGYNTNNGCQFYEGKPICRDEGDTFEIKYGFPSYRNVKYGPQNLTSTDCRLICWRDCDCVGFTFYNYNETGCLFFLSSKGINYVRDTGFELHMLKKNIQGHSGKGKHKWLWIRISGAAAMICALICICIVYRVKMKNKVTGVNVNAIKVFSISSLRVATNDFSNENKLGSGGFGVVYKGTLPSGEEVAVKRLHKSAGESAIGQIKNELTLMSQVQHKNLVQVLGYCIYEQKLLLVLEFVKNTSLHTILFGDGSTEKKELVWEERYQIIEGIALGLYYLHSLYSDNKIIHRDLKPANILLDENMNPKIADFGLATLLQANEQAPLKELEGTAGYIAPEYANGAEISDKGDVYSFGVIVLQILSVQKAVVSEAYVVGATPVYRSLVQCAWELCQEGEILSLKDPLLSDLFNVEILKFLEIGLACTQKLEDRPTMATIIPLILDRNRTNLELELKNPYIWQMSSDRLIHTDNMDQESEPLLYSRTGMSFSIYRSFVRRVESKAAIERIYSL